MTTSSKREGHVSDSADKITPTNRMLLRSYSDMPYAKEMFYQLVGNLRDVQKNMLKVEPIKLLINASVSEARSRKIDKILKDSGIKQVLDVAAGFSPRGLYFTRNPSTIYVEADLDKIMQKKEDTVDRLAKREGLSRSNLFFQSANTFSYDNLSKAYSHFDNRPVAIITESLMDDLYISEKRAVARNIRSLLMKHEGIWITSNMPSKQRQDDLQSVRDILRHQRDQLLFNSQDEIRRLFEIVGLKEERYKTLESPSDLSVVMKAPRTLGVDISPLLEDVISNDITRVLRVER